MLPQIKTLSPRHDAIMEWLVANPEKKLGECAKAFGVSQSWLSCIIHSDIFQAGYKKMLGEYHDTRIIPLRDKVIGIAHVALDRLAEQAPAAPLEQSLDIANGMLKAAGFGSPNVRVNMPNGIAVISAVTPEDLQRARDAYRNAQRLTNEKQVIDVPALAAPEPTGSG